MLTKVIKWSCDCLAILIKYSIETANNDEIKSCGDKHQINLAQLEYAACIQRCQEFLITSGIYPQINNENKSRGGRRVSDPPPTPPIPTSVGSNSFVENPDKIPYNGVRCPLICHAELMIKCRFHRHCRV